MSENIASQASPCASLKAVVDAAKVALAAAELALSICEALNAPSNPANSTEAPTAEN